MSLLPSCPLESLLVVPQHGSLDEAADIQEAETRAFQELSDVLGATPGAALQALAALAMRITHADSAGISLEEETPAGTVFRWVATAGGLTPYVNGIMPRRHSPCGATLKAGKPLVMRDPALYYRYFEQFPLPVRVLLLVPFSRGDRLIGTVWVLQHTSPRVFTQHDLRAVESLSAFVCEVLDADSGTPH